VIRRPLWRSASAVHSSMLRRRLAAFEAYLQVTALLNSRAFEVTQQSISSVAFLDVLHVAFRFAKLSTGSVSGCFLRLLPGPF
jgi:hypothetical protein